MALRFADTFFFIATIDPADRYHAAAAVEAADLSHQTVTSEPILVELFGWASGRGAYQRRLALSLIDGTAT